MPRRPRPIVRALVASAVALGGLVAAAPPAHAAYPVVDVWQDGGCWWLERGKPTPIQLRLWNTSTDRYLQSVRVAPRLPAGWTATVPPAEPLPPGSPLLVRVDLTPPAGAPIGPSPLLRFDVTSNGTDVGSYETPVTVVDAPAAPADVVATRGDGTATVSWTPAPSHTFPAEERDEQRRRYTVTASPGGSSTVVHGTRTAKVAGLSNGTAYTFTVTEWNYWGSAVSAPSAPVVPAGVPDRVTGVTATGTGTTRLVSWQPAAANGAPLTGYTVTVRPGGRTVAAAADATSAEVTGLDAGTSYEFAVHATNGVGAGPASDDARPPRFTGDVTVLTEDASWVLAEISDPTGPAVDGWLVTSHPDGAEQYVERQGDGTGVAYVGDNAPGTSVTVSVRGVDAAGTGPASAQTAPVVRYGRGGDVETSRPVLGDGTVELCFLGDSGGGGEVTKYVVESLDGEQWTFPATARRAVLTGLTPGTYYGLATYAVTPASDPRADRFYGVGVEAIGRPAAVTGAVATPGDGNVALDFARTGARTSGYEVTVSPGGRSEWLSGQGWSDFQLWGLANGTAYTFTVRGRNELGFGPATVVGPVTPTAAPGEVTGITVTRTADDAVRVAWSPAAPNGSAITGYRVTTSPGGAVTTAAADATSVVVDGLGWGIPYTFEVAATNAHGTGQSGFSPPITLGDPTFGGRTVAVRPPAALSLSGSLALGFSLADAASYDVRYRFARYDGLFGGYRYPAAWQATAATRVTRPMTVGLTYCLSVRARDLAGSVTAWSPNSCSTAPVDDSAMPETGVWSRGGHAGYYLGSYSATVTRGSALTLPVRARRLALVATSCAACGDVGVYLDGVLVRRVRLAAATTRYRTVVPVDLGRLRAGTVTLRALSGRVYVDGLAATRV